MTEDVSLESMQRANRQKGIRIIAVICFICFAACALVYSEINNNEESPYGNVTDNALNVVVCHSTSKSLRKVIDESMTGYRMTQKAIVSGTGNGIDNLMIVIRVSGMFKNESGSLEKAEFSLDVTDPLYNSSGDMVLYRAEIGGRKITDKSKLAEIKQIMCGQSSRRSYI